MMYIPKKEKANYYLGLTGQNMTYALVGGSFFTYFLTDTALFPTLVVTVMLVLMKVWDGVNDPIVGSYVDQHSFKNGEKLRPFLLYTPLPVGVFTVLMFLVFSTKEDLLWLRIAYFVLMYICWDLAYTFQDVAIWGITACISPNSEERGRFVQWARTFGTVGFGVFGMAIPMILEIVVNKTGATMSLMVVVFALIFGFGGSMLSLRCHHAQERIRVNVQSQQQGLGESFRLLFKNKMMLLVTASNLLGALGFGGHLVTYFFKYKIPANFLGTSGILGAIGALGLTTIFAAITSGLHFFGMLLADRMKHWLKNYVNVLIFIQICSIIVRVIAFFIGYTGHRLWLSMILIGIGSMPGGASSIAQTTIFCDSIDYMEYKTGKRTEGVTFSIQTSFTKISAGITMGLSTLALHLLHYKAIPDDAAVFLGTQSAAFETWIWPLVILTPAAASVLVILPLLFVRYSAEERAVVEATLKARRAKAEEQTAK